MKDRILRKYLITLCFVFSFQVGASEWVSPIDNKYKNRDNELFSKFDRARTILDSWRGQQEKLIEANRLLGEVVEKDAEFAPAYREYGRLILMEGYINNSTFEGGSKASAVSWILKSIEIESDYADSYVLLGHAFTKLKRYDEAKKYLMRAELIGTESPWLYINWADLLKKQKKYNEAMNKYKAVIEKGTENKKAYISALSGIKKIYIKMRKYDEANEYFNKIIKYEPESAWNWGNYSSFLLFTYRDVDGAIKNGEKALSIMNYGMENFTLACALYTKWAILKEQENQIAQVYFDRAYEIYPYIGKVIEKTGKYKYTRITAKSLQKILHSDKVKSHPVMGGEGI